MLRLFALKNTVLDDAEIFESKLALIDGARRESVNSLAGVRAKSRSLSAGIILPLALSRCGIGGEVKIERGERGKPRLVAPQGVFFNLSHSGGYTLVALSDSEVGCDIQEIKPVNLRLAERYFHPEESRRICGCESDGEKRELFFRYWCAKESFIKATGEGLTRPLGSFYVRLPEEGRTGRVETDGRSGDFVCGEVFEADGAPTPWRVAESGQIEGYSIAVCTRRPRQLTLEWLSV